MCPLSKPLVSIVTPVYNGAKYFVECIESVLSQTYQNWEYLILNNCSTDKTLYIAESYAKRDKRIRILNNTKFIPALENHNKAVKLISDDSKYCKILHADDLLFPECVEQMVKVAEDNLSVGIVGAYMLQGEYVVGTGFPGKELRHSLQYPNTIISGRDICRHDIFTKGPSVLGSPTTTLIKCDIIRKYDKFYNESIMYADRAICYDILQGHDFGFIHQVLTFMRIHAEQRMSFMFRVNGWICTRLYMLKKYGPVFLDSKEYSSLWKQRIKEYYNYLGEQVYYKGVVGKQEEFWKYHREELEKIGCPISKMKLTWAFIVFLLEHALNLIFVCRFVLGKSYKILNVVTSKRS